MSLHAVLLNSLFSNSKWSCRIIFQKLGTWTLLINQDVMFSLWYFIFYLKFRNKLKGTSIFFFCMWQIPTENNQMTKLIIKWWGTTSGHIFKVKSWRICRTRFLQKKKVLRQRYKHEKCHECSVEKKEIIWSLLAMRCIKKNPTINLFVFK